MIILLLSSGALIGLLVWKLTDLESDVKELRSRVEELEDE